MINNNSQLEQIANILDTKFSSRLRFNSTTSEFTTKFKTPIELNRNLNYELGLASFTTCNIVYNINPSNNSFSVSTKQNKNQFIITPGAYELKELFSRMKKLIFEKFQVDGEDTNNKKIKVSPIELKVDIPTARIDLYIKTGYSFSFSSGLGEFLGFQKNAYSKNSRSEKRTNITDITTVNVMCNIVQGSYQNGVRDQCIYDFPYGTVPHGYQIIQLPNPPDFVPIIPMNHIYEITIKIVDQNENLIDFNGEDISITLILKQV